MTDGYYKAIDEYMEECKARDGDNKKYFEKEIDEQFTINIDDLREKFLTENQNNIWINELGIVYKVFEFIREEIGG